MMYFINAADELIKEEGIENATIRKVANKAGYNSATIYNYFENIDHLIFYVAMKNLKDYAVALNTYIKDSKNAMDIYLKVWDCICDHAYRNPEMFNAIYFPKVDRYFEDYVVEYYENFPEDMVTDNERIETMLLKKDLRNRGEVTVLACVEEDYIRKDDADTLNDMTHLIFEGMLKRVLRKSISYEEAFKKSRNYIKIITKLFLIKDYDFYY